MLAQSKTNTGSSTFSWIEKQEFNKKKEEEIRQLKNELKKNAEAQKEKERESEKERCNQVSQMNRAVIDADMKKKRKQKGVSTSNTQRKQITKQRPANEKEKDEEEREELPWQEWKILYPYKDINKKGTLRFAVNMYGTKLKEGEEPQFPTWTNLHKDGAGEMADKYIREECNFPPWSDLLIGTSQGRQEKRKRL